MSSLRRGEIRWYTFAAPDKRRPVLLLTRDDVIDVWALRFSCGLEVSLLVFRLRGFEALAPTEPGGIEVHASQHDEAHLCFHLGLAPEDVSRWVPDPLRHAPAVWRVRRQDDNGNVVDVDSFTSGCEARAVATMFEQRGHKQLYWVERM